MKIGPDVNEELRDPELESYIAETEWHEMSATDKPKCLLYLIQILHLSTAECDAILNAPKNSTTNYVSKLGGYDYIRQQPPGSITTRGEPGLQPISSLKRPEPALSPREQELLETASKVRQAK